LPYIRTDNYIILYIACRVEAQSFHSRENERCSLVGYDIAVVTRITEQRAGRV